MDGLGDNMKKIVLAGIGAVAVTAEKSKDVLDELVKKGELTVEQGKELNEELKHNIKQTLHEKTTVNNDSAEDVENLLENMTAEQITRLKEKLQQMEVEQEAEETLAE